MGDQGTPDVILVAHDDSWREEARAAMEQRGLAVHDTDGDADGVIVVAASFPAAVVVIGPSTTGNIVRAVAELHSMGGAPIVLGSATDELELLLMLAAGAAGFLALHAPPDEIAGAVAAVRGGRVVLPDAAGPALLDVLRNCGRGIEVTTADGRRRSLTQREWEVYVLHRQDRTTAEIARRLFVSPVTVRTHLLALRHKLAAADIVAR